MIRPRLLAGIALLLASNAYGGPVACVPDTLANYIALGPTGCMVGPILVFRNFSFGLVSASGGAVPVTAAGITVNPVVVSPVKYGLNYASGGFSVTSGQAVQYLLAYTIDEPPIIHEFEEDMFTNSPVFPGLASITSEKCLGAPFSGAACPPAFLPTLVQTVFDNGVAIHHVDIQSFPLTGIIGDRTTITLDASAGGSANFTSFTEAAIVIPEPAAGMLMGLGVFVLFAAKRRGKKLSASKLR